MPDAQTILEVKNLSVEFRTRLGLVRAVRDVSWSVGQGETLAILGESGSGKSVSAAAVMNLIDCPPGQISSGTILYRGTDLLRLAAEDRREISGRKISMIFQDPLAALNPVYPVGWQIAETMRVHGTDEVSARRRVIELLERVGIPDPARRAKDYPHQFSGGQRQRIMIASAIALRPDLLIADEPTSALDVTVQAQVLDLLKELQAETDMGLVLITHDLGVVRKIGDRVIVMQEGQVVESGTVDGVFTAPAHPYTRRLLDSVPGGKGQRKSSGQDRDEPAFLEVRNVAKHYPVTSGMFRRGTGEVVRAVADVSFELRAGETLGIVGESGSGKSTVARMLLGLDEPSAGKILYEGRDVRELSRPEWLALRRQVQFVFQDPTASLNPRMTIRQIVSEPWAIHKNVLPREEWDAKVAELLIRVGLKADHADRHPHQFSGGQRQRIAIARALTLRPKLILCDEAVSALDVSIQAQVIALLKELRRDFGLSYIFIAHDLALVRDFATRVLVMYKGELVEQGYTADLFESPQHPYTKALLSASTVPDLDRKAS